MIEVWKDVYYVDILTGKVYDYRGFYQVSNLGYEFYYLDEYGKGGNQNE